MISHHHKCIFIHIPKTAGQSVEHFFLESLGLDWEKRAPLLLRSNDIPELGPPRLAHLKAMEYVRCKYISSDQFNSYFKFSFVRNPWDRIVSMYKHFKMNRVCNFKKFLFEKFHKNIYKKHYWFVCPQSEYLCDDNGGLLVDFVGRFENIQEDFADICRVMNIECSQLPHVNVDGGNMKLRRHPKLIMYNIIWHTYGRYRIPTYSDYHDYYDNDSRRLVEELYATDIDMFKYKFSDGYK